MFPFPSSSSMIASRYSLTRLLGRGGMGEVYEATHKTTGRRVAVKRLNFIHRVSDEETRTELMGRLKREARAMGALQSPHIVQILDAGEDPETGEPFIVMEYLDGEDVADLCRTVGPLPVDLALRIVHQASLGLARAHEAGVVHRDVKPANIFLVRSDETTRVAKILDFGIARIVPQQQSPSGELTDLTHTGNVMGSPEFMAPEQVRGFKTVDARADVWALGRVLFKLLTGQTPHHNEGAGFGAVLLGICTVPAPSVQTLAPWVSPEVAELVRRALSIPPERRYADAGEMSAAIRALLPDGTDILESMIASATVSKGTRVVVAAQGTGTVRMSTDALGGPISSPEPAPPVASKAPEPALPKSRAPVVFIGLALASTLIVGAAGLLYFRPLASAPPRPTVATITQEVTAPPPMVVSLARAVPLKVPSDARVEVDGIVAPVHDGIVDVAGALGTTHRVRVTLGDRESVVVVAITENGALPPEIVVATPPPPSSPPRHTAAPSGASKLTTKFE